MGQAAGSGAADPAAPATVLEMQALDSLYAATDFLKRALFRNVFATMHGPNNPRERSDLLGCNSAPVFDTPKMFMGQLQLKTEPYVD